MANERFLMFFFDRDPAIANQPGEIWVESAELTKFYLRNVHHQKTTPFAQWLVVSIQGKGVTPIPA